MPNAGGEELADGLPRRLVGAIARVRVSQMVAASVGEIITRNQWLEDKIKVYSTVKDVMDEAGITDSYAWAARREAEHKLLGGIRSEVSDSLAKVHEAAANAIKLLTLSPVDGTGGSKI